jgi:membrane fusion protein, multidrug efflux system
MTANKILLFAAFAGTLAAQVETARVTQDSVQRKVLLTGEFLPYLSVAITPRVTGYVDRVEVDRGSIVRQGQLLAVLSAPELKTQLAEAAAKVQSIESQRVEAEANLTAAQSTLGRLRAAAETPGAVANNEVVVAGKQVASLKAVVDSLENSRKAAAAAADSIRELMSFLQITAPFDGVITERLVHPGALAGPANGPLLRLEQNTRLRLVVAVPEAEVAGAAYKGAIPFTVPAYPGETFTGTVARISHSIDQKTRTMPVELEVPNPKTRLAPGMYPEIAWPSRQAKPSLLVPASAVVTTTERVFVIRVRSGRAEWVNVKKGVGAREMVEVSGDLAPGDVVVKRATDEIRDGSAIRVTGAGKTSQ